MPEYVLNRNHTLRSPNGVVSFIKGQPAWVIPSMEREVQMIGGERVSGEAPPLLDAEKVVQPELSHEDRTGQMYAAFELISEKNDAKEFTAQGVPTVKAVEKIVDFTVERAEIVELWSEYRLSKVEQ